MKDAGADLHKEVIRLQSAPHLKYVSTEAK
jgi:hypothetical protein